MVYDSSSHYVMSAVAITPNTTGCGVRNNGYLTFLCDLYSMFIGERNFRLHYFFSFSELAISFLIFISNNKPKSFLLY